MVTKLRPEVAKTKFARFLTGEEAGGEHRAYCPVCEDPDSSSSPSASFNFNKGVWKCQGKCGKGGGIANLARGLKSGSIKSEAINKPKSAKPSPSYTFRSSSGKFGSDKEDTPVDPEDVKKWAAKLFNTESVLKQLTEERGLTEDTIREWNLGWNGQRYTIPVYDADGNLYNVRKYLINAGARGKKMIHIPGKDVTLFGASILRDNDIIVLCEGEMDCILLNQYGIPAVATTAGAGTWLNAWNVEFSGKTVYVCYDNDDTGRQGAKKAGQGISAYADQIYQIDIPIPNKGADVTDFLHLEGNGAEEFRQLMKAARPMDPTRHVVAEPEPDSGKHVELEESMSHDLQNEVLEMRVSVIGKRNPPFAVPRRVNFECGMDKNPTLCAKCPLDMRGGNLTYEFSKNDEILVDFIDVPKEKHGAIVREDLGVLCSSHSKFTVEETYNMEQLIVSNSVDNRSLYVEQTPTEREVFSVNTHATKINSTARVVGRNAVAPRTSRRSMIAWNVEPVQTSLDTFELTKELRDQLYSFQQNEEQDPLDKCLEIAQDLSENVTRIYDRDILHVAYDLVWHSPLAFEVEGQMIEKGWLEMMVVGDTRTGKSETAMRLADHYQAGIVKSCEGATFAGLVGGVQQVGGNGTWITTWGLIPLNDRRLVVLDEVSGLKDKDVIENMSSIRSSGKAQITKINTQETSARTRLIWITNPGDGMMIDERPDVGVGALRSVVKNQEDIARFDYVVAARASEVDSNVINSTRLHDRRTPFYTSEMCQSLVLWAWSLKADQIRFLDSAVAEARKISAKIGEEYVADPPLIQTENIRFKLYRIAAAIAARTFAIRWPEKGKMELVVTKDHIKAAKRFLDMIYDSEGMEYRSASRTVIAARERARKNRINAKNYLIQHEPVLATLRAVSKDTKWKTRDFEEFGGMHRDEAALAMKTLGQFGMVQRKPQGYVVMDKMLVSILRELEREDY